MVDPVTVELVENALYSMEKEMEATILRTAMSIVIREVYDFGIATLDANGRMIHGLSMSAELIREMYPLEEIHEGDVFIYNDPYHSRGEMTHLGDTQLCRPVFWEGRLVAFAAIWGHHMDVGGIAPSGLPSTSTEIFYEGLQIPPVKLFEHNVLNKAVLDIMARNSRTPEMMIGDTLAMASACTITERRLHEVMAKYGAATVLECFDVFAERAHTAMGKLIAQLPEGKFSFEDFLDDDGIEEGYPRIHMTVEKCDGRLVVDFAGTSGQARGPINMIMNPNREKLSLWRSLITWVGPLIGMDEQASANYGVFDQVEVRIPKPSLLAPEYPAAVGARHMVMSLNGNVFRGVMSQIFPDRTPACSNAVIPVYMFRGFHPETSQSYVSMECIPGGGGARPHVDGIDGLSPNKSLTIAPVEFLEATYPFLVEQTVLRCDTGGPGKFRGGVGVIRSFLIRGEEARITWMDDRQTHPAWGLNGGMPGTPGDAYLVRDGQTFRLPTKYDNLALRRGDRIVVRTGGGGGFGPPWERDVALVVADVAKGYVSAHSAREHYGVVLDGQGGFDPDATATVRARIASASSVEKVNRGEVRWAPPPGSLVPVAGVGAE